MRLIHLSDLHFGAVDPGLPGNLRTAIIAAKADLLVVSGDLTQRGRKAEFQQAKEFLDSLPLPKLVVPGNHDVQGSWNFWERFTTPFRNYQNIIHADMEPVWSEPGLIVSGANSARPVGWNLDWSRGRLSGRQVARMAKQYELANTADLRVFVVHHPPAAPPGGTERHLIGRLKEFTAFVNEAGVDLVLSGHFHMSYAQTLPLPGAPHTRSCVFSSVSTATSHRLKGEPNGFHLIDGNHRQLTIRDWAWTGMVYAERRAWEFKADSVTRNWRRL